MFYQAGAWCCAELAADSGVPDDGGGFDRVTLAQNVRSAGEVDADVAAAADAGLHGDGDSARQTGRHTCCTMCAARKRGAPS